MDLDKLKNTWNNTSIQPKIDDEKIYRMLDKKGKSALQRLLWFEWLGVILIPILIAVIFIHQQHNPKVPYSTFTMTWIYSFCVLIFFWQLFKIRLLKKINPENSDILASFKAITQYKKYIRYELLIGCIWLVVYIFSYSLSILAVVNESRQTVFIITLCIITVVIIAFVLLLYRKVYSKNINSIKRSIGEIKDFEEENG